MASLAKLRTAVKYSGISDLIRHNTLDPQLSTFETVTLRYKNREMLLHSPVKMERGQLSLFSMIRNLITDASGYEAASGNYRDWCVILDLDFRDRAARKSFDIIKANSNAFRKLVGNRKYCNLIELINEINGWHIEL